MQAEEPEMARLIDQASSLESLCNFLPQISVNTTTKVLDSLQPSAASSTSLPRSNSSFSSVLNELSKASNLITTPDDFSSCNAANKPVLFKLEDLAEDISSQLQQPLANHNHTNYHQPPLQMHSSTSFKELCELLSIKKVSSGSKLVSDASNHSQLTKLKLVPSPLTSSEESKLTLKPSRTSMRLFQKRNIKKEVKKHFLLHFSLNF